MGVGPIPWTAIVQYIEYHEFTKEQADELVYYAYQMDNVYIEYFNAKQQK